MQIQTTAQSISHDMVRINNKVCIFNYAITVIWIRKDCPKTLNYLKQNMISQALSKIQEFLIHEMANV